MELGQLVLDLGGGRKQLGDEIDRGVGFVLDAHIGSQVQAGENWITIYHREPLSELHRRKITDALTLSDDIVEPNQRIIEIL